jgi:hypothetical protein
LVYSKQIKTKIKLPVRIQLVFLKACKLSLEQAQASLYHLKVLEKSGYEALPWVRYITQSGDYQLRMS